MPEPVRKADEIEATHGIVPDGILPILLARIPWEAAVARRVSMFAEDGRSMPLTVAWKGTASVRIRDVPRSVGVLEVTEMKRAQEDKGDPSVLWIAEGKAWTVKAESGAFSMVLGTAEEARCDLSPETPDEQAARRVACQFMRATALGEAALLFEVSDLAALQDRWGRVNGRVAAFGPAEFRDCLDRWLVQLRSRGEAYLADQRKLLEGLAATLPLEVNGARAVANGGPGGQGIHLEKRDGAWKVVWWEVMGGWR
ncbi:MAG: hypothetical protein L0216_06110 [Planctomycetales bacterium]|nr:hypothetical protein [Planctomycetales bacterium]